MKTRRRGFTLVEILVVVAMTGLIAVTAFAPLIHTVGVLRDLERSFGDASGLRLASAHIVGDMRQYQQAPRGPAFRLIRHDLLGGKADDVLLFWSISPLRQGQPAGTVIYRLGSKKETAGSLLRWVLAGVIPQEVNPAALDEREGQLVLQGVEAFRVAALQGGRWADEYAGILPQAVRLTLGRGEVESVYEDWLPQVR